MGVKKIFQTLEDRNNPDEVESQGPFICTNNPWLGKGYYFWDTFLDLAHWWGKQVHSGNYIICQTFIEDNSEYILDLVGNTQHLIEFKEYADVLKQTYNTKGPITVPFIIEHMKKMTDFHYKAIRANPINSTSGDEYFNSQKLRFIKKNPAYLELIPPIQICVINKGILGKNRFRIIYPETYCEGYTI